MSKITFYIARHGKTLMNTLNRMQGWCNSPLTKEGIKVAEYLGYGLQDVSFRTAYTSDLPRTLQTAQVVLNKAMQENIPILELEGFREACFGSFEASDNDLLWDYISLYLHYTTVDAMDEGLAKGEITYADIQNSLAAIDKLKIAETYQQVETRTQATLRNVAEQESLKGDANILIISHGQAIAAMLLSLGGDKILTGDLTNASVCKVEYENGKFSVLSMGDTQYIKKGEQVAKNKKE